MIDRVFLLDRVQLETDLPNETGLGRLASCSLFFVIELSLNEFFSVSDKWESPSCGEIVGHRGVVR